MRSVTYILSSEPGVYDQWGLQDAGVRLVAIHDVHVLADGTVIILFESEEAPDALEAVCERTLSDVDDYQVADSDGSSRLKVHCCPSDRLASIIGLHREYPVLTDYPIEYVSPDETDVRVIKVGRTSDLNGFVQAIGEIAHVSVEHIGRYDPGGERVFAELTARQRTILQTAVEAGYYDVPRGVSCADLARELNCSAGTVSQHLRRIESTVFSQFVTSPELPKST